MHATASALSDISVILVKMFGVFFFSPRREGNCLGKGFGVFFPTEGRKFFRVFFLLEGRILGGFFEKRTIL